MYPWNHLKPSIMYTSGRHMLWNRDCKSHFFFFFAQCTERKKKSNCRKGNPHMLGHAFFWCRRTAGNFPLPLPPCVETFLPCTSEFSLSSPLFFLLGQVGVFEIAGPSPSARHINRRSCARVCAPDGPLTCSLLASAAYASIQTERPGELQRKPRGINGLSRHPAPDHTPPAGDSNEWEYCGKYGNRGFHFSSSWDLVPGTGTGHCAVVMYMEEV